MERSREPKLEHQDHLDHLVLEHPSLLDHMVLVFLVQSRTSPDEEEEFIMTSCLLFFSHEHFGFEVQIKMREVIAPPYVAGALRLTAQPRLQRQTTKDCSLSHEKSIHKKGSLEGAPVVDAERVKERPLEATFNRNRKL